MNAAIVDAIRTKRCLRFDYHGRLRIAEPQCYGKGTKGTELLRVHQRQGGSQAEPPFDVAKMKDLVIREENPDRPGPNDRRNDSAMATIHCQL